MDEDDVESVCIMVHIDLKWHSPVPHRFVFENDWTIPVVYGNPDEEVRGVRGAEYQVFPHYTYWHPTDFLPSTRGITPAARGTL